MDAEQAKQVFSRATRLYDAGQVRAAVSDMAQSIDSHYRDLDPLVICMMNGGLIASGLILAELQSPLNVDYLHATRYRGATSGAELQWQRAPSMDLRGRHVLLIDDILDQGFTLQAVLESCRAQGAQSVRSAVLADKVEARKVAVEADFVGLRVPDRYLFGFGMDYRNYLRNAPGIYAVDPADE
jgi:hypoxanthine phosphoribosyltransferase